MKPPQFRPKHSLLGNVLVLEIGCVTGFGLELVYSGCAGAGSGGLRLHCVNSSGVGSPGTGDCMSQRNGTWPGNARQAIL